MDYELLHKFSGLRMVQNKIKKAQMAKHLGMAPSNFYVYFNAPSEWRIGWTNKLMAALDCEPIVHRTPIPDMPASDLINQLIRARLNLNLPASRVAARLDVAPTTLTNWETGKGSGPKLWQLETWSRLLGLGGIGVPSIPFECAYPVALHPDPSEAEVERMHTTGEYYACRYGPYSIERARGRYETGMSAALN